MQKVSRLITEFTPHTYTISLDIDREKRTFSGTETVVGQSHNGRICLHAKNITISTIAVDGTQVAFSTGENDELEIIQTDPIPGERSVEIKFSGYVNNTLHGLYLSTFKEGGVTQEILTTQFESHHAREVFPCVDEPEAKAIFNLTLTTDANITVLGNMPIKNQSTSQSRMTTEFESSPKMSTYLLAFVAGSLQSVSGTTKDGVEVAVWSTPAHPKTHLAYALDTAIKATEFYNEYFATPYPLPKADHVALPDFDAGAMENWGLITYRESALLVDPDNRSLPGEQYVTSVICHELSHQWFGNLVTMKWWNNLWLNESFATLMEAIAAQALHPDWDVWLDFSTNDAVMAIRRDSIPGVQAVQTDVNHPDEISSLFDGAIVYAKGARLMLMLERFIGEEAFRDGLRQYFSTHAYNNTEENDLWAALSSACGQDVGSMMNAWISQSGFPVVSVDIQNDRLKLSQQRFLITGENDTTGTLWPIPLDANDPNLPKVFDEAELSLKKPADSSLLVLNARDSTHFITRYDTTLFSTLADAVESGKIDTIGRIKILFDRITLARSGSVNPASLLTLLTSYRHESSEHVWEIISLAIKELVRYTENDNIAENALKKIVISMASSVYERLGWDENDTELVSDRKLRSRIIDLMLYAEDQSVVDEAMRRVQLGSLEQLPADQRASMMSAKLRYGDTPAYADELLKRYGNESSPDIRDDIRSVLTSTRDQALIDRLLGTLKDTSVIRTQDTTFWYINLQANRFSRDKAWLWLRENWSWIESEFGSNKSYIYYPRYAAQFLNSATFLAQYKELFTPMLDNPALQRTIEMGITDIEVRAKLIEQYEDSVTKAIKISAEKLP